MTYPGSIREINNLPDTEKMAIYGRLVPQWVFDQYNISPTDYTANGYRAIRFRCPSGSRSFEATIKRCAKDLDPLLYFHMADTFNNQISVLLVVVNDPDAPRFNVDVDQDGNPTHLGTRSRNLPAEVAAMQAGLAPGQVRNGLRVFRSLVPVFENFVTDMGHQMFLIEPLAYHNAIIFERYGFNYVQGLQAMHDIHREFQPGGKLYEALTPSSPFRQPDAAWRTVRGRSWAIHDGILGHSYTGFQMYKRIGHHAGITTFPDMRW
jgi:hypothetical protein